MSIRSCREPETEQPVEQPTRTVLFLIGTRPELIKLAPVLWHMPADVRSVVCFTGQHEGLVDALAPALRVRPDHRLRVMRPGQPLATLTARLLDELGALIARERPDVVVGQGDTATVLAGSLAAFFARVPFAHVEAGLRSHDLGAPFPEEANRRLAAVTTSLHLAPTAGARAHLLAEGIPAARIQLVGNPVVDAVRATAASLPLAPTSERRTILLTTHRRENFGAPLQRILEAVRRVALARPDVDIIWPVHPNPAVRAASAALADLSNVALVDPLDYVALVEVLRRATLVLTDSGGLQEEAPSLGVPVLVLRETTERPEGVAAGVARLVGTDVDRIVAEVERLLDDEDVSAAMRAAMNPYGDGEAGRRIAAALSRPFPTVFGDGPVSPLPVDDEGGHRPSMKQRRAGIGTVDDGKPLAA
jgi:UDP-N-acetylglucosamine 2-epimerase (non-hydrolysing)